MVSGSQGQVVTTPSELPRPRSRGRRHWTLRVYAAVATIVSILTLPHLLMRARAGKEDLERIAERRAITKYERPQGRLIWLHAASVGEILSALPLAKELLLHNLADNILVTTGTVSSARMVDERAVDNIIHQYVPLDVPRYAGRFIHHWQPDGAIFIESELWPNLIYEIALANIPLAFVNGRMSEKSFARWQRWPASSKNLFKTVQLVLAQSADHASRFSALGAVDVRHLGNLKFDTPALPVSENALVSFNAMVGQRPVWLAASTHEGEERLIAEAHFIIRKRYPELLTIIVPRHPDRASTIVKMLEELQLVVARRSKAEPAVAKSDVYLADTLGELGLFYRYCDIAFIGGSLVEVGGHNPIESAQLGCVVIHGPHVQNFVDTYKLLNNIEGVVVVKNENELANQVTDLLSQEERRKKLNRMSQVEITRNKGSLERIVLALSDKFDG
jgi:3-deoxy-D-manno-octulosonic-acid transferase